MPKFKITKEIKQELDILASKLPVIAVSKKLTVTGAEIKTNPEYAKLNKPGIINTKKYIIRTDGLLEAVNHKKRLYKAFENEGLEGVKKYADPYKPKKQNDTDSISNDTAGN
jgi:hypothetical protein